MNFSGLSLTTASVALVTTRNICTKKRETKQTKTKKKFQLNLKDGCEIHIHSTLSVSALEHSLIPYKRNVQQQEFVEDSFSSAELCESKKGALSPLLIQTSPFHISSPTSYFEFFCNLACFMLYINTTKNLNSIFFWFPL